MTKVSVPLNLSKFRVVSGDPEEIRDFMGQLRAAEDAFTSSADYDRLAEALLDGSEVIAGSKNSWGRTRIPSAQFPYQPYNLNEMLRTSILNKVEAYAASVGLFRILRENSSAGPVEVKERFEEEFSLPVPTAMVVKSHIHRFTVKGQRQAVKPQATGFLPLYASDRCFSRVSRDGRTITLSIALPSGRGVFEFLIPEGDRWEGKVSKPTITERNGRLAFNFSVISTVDVTARPKRLGVDLGIVEPFVATVVDSETMTFSAPYFADKHVNRARRKAESLYSLRDRLLAKEEKCRASGHIEKADRLAVEADRVRQKAGQQKDEATSRAAAQITRIAVENDASIAFERLNWLGATGGKWNHAEIQSGTQHNAARHGIATRKVSAAGTSQTCTRCHGEVRHSRRNNICGKCRFKINRDVEASREIGARDARIKMRELLRQRNSAGARPSYPVPGAVERVGAGPHDEVTLVQVRTTDSSEIPT